MSQQLRLFNAYEALPYMPYRAVVLRLPTPDCPNHRYTAGEMQPLTGRQRLCCSAIAVLGQTFPKGGH